MRDTLSPRASLLLVLPAPIVRFLRLMRDLTWEERRKFMGLQMGRSFRRREMVLPKKGEQPVRMLIVCHGNIMRSPYAAALLSELVRKAGLSSEWQIDSAGVLALPGRPADRRAQAAAAQRGFSLDTHVSSPLWDDLVEGSALIFVMDAHNEAVLLTRYPEHEQKVFFLGSFGRTARNERFEIDDPFAATPAAADEIFARIDRAARALWAELRRGTAQK